MALTLVVSPLLSFLVLKAGNSMIKQFCHMHGMKKSCKKLHRHFLAIQAVIANAEERGVNEPHVEAWLKGLNAVAYEAVDVLDEFQYEALRQQAINQEPSSSIKKVFKNINLHDNAIVFRYKMSRKLTKVLEKINEIILEMNTFNFTVHDLQPVIHRPPTHSYVMESEVIGRNNEKEKIMNILLLDPNREMDNVSVLVLVGMGGVGKTTLAQLIYNDEKVKMHFELRMWVCISNDFNIVNIIKSIIEVATNEQCEPPHNLEVLQKKLRNNLAGKKYLLVLDDVWNEDIQKWDALKTLLFSGICAGSAILVTTRNKGVASIMRSVPDHDLVMLSKEDSWELFRKRVFHGTEEPHELVQLGRKIVDRCAGLPLALKAIGGLMRTKREVDEWRAISQNKIWDGETSINGILPALKLSYDLLPSYMKQCFIFCANFPQDCKIVKETLIQLWKSNDLIPNDKNINVDRKGQYIFRELYFRSFLQDIEEEKNLYGKIEITCKMHGLMHDLAKTIAGKQCATAIFEVKNDLVLHFSVKVGHSPNNLNTILKECPTIHTCLIHGKFATESNNVKHSDSVKSISLRELQMHGCGQPPKQLEYMKHLRYLDLSWGKFDSLPGTISTLYNLRTLNLSYSKVSKLPEDMRYMISLEDLKFDGCEKLKKIPIYLGKLKSLRTLTKYMIDCDPGRSIEELKNLNLHEHLILTGLENVKDRNEAEAANMVSKTKLYSLVLNWNSPENEDAPIHDGEVLEGLKPYYELKHLFISGYTGSEFAAWMKDTSVIKNLRILKVYNCHNCMKLPPIWQLPLLENLELKQTSA